ncbi:MAG: toll/interleukin-1 receptor domain-containing protein [Pyrinomonadaceae bacterium]
MRERINKPRVFLSHARKDVEFIEKVEKDLRRCQIEPWRDLNEIRDGESWQNVIFAEGIPACDVFITYYTENSVTSEMVSKEVDTALLRQLSDNGIGFLPYVDSDETRNNLRLDIKALQCRVWNEDNYNEVISSVVAEIWRRYTERAIPLAILQEKAKRLELELEIKNLQARMSDSAFSPQEEKEFQYYTNKLSESYPATCIVSIQKDNPNISSNETQRIRIAEYHFSIPLIWFLVKCVWNGEVDPSWTISGHLTSAVKKIGNFIDLDSKQEWIDNPKSYNANFDTSIYNLLEILGIIVRHKSDPNTRTLRIGQAWRFTEKMRRFVYWLDYYQKPVDVPKTTINFLRNEAFEETVE